MAIQLRVATSLDQLSAELTSDLGSEILGVFDKQLVITQTDGINNWLRQQLVIKIGIAANLQFVKMNDVLQMLYYWTCPEAPILIDKDRMTWAIFVELREVSFCETFPSIAAYYTNNESRRAALAAEMADLFDQYQVYRHDKIAQWKKNEENEDATVEWQVYLWKKMKNRLGNEFLDRLDVSRMLLEKMNDENAKKLIKLRMPCLRFFGLAIVTPYYLELFRELSKIIDVKFYLINPCPEDLWIDDVSDRKIAKLRNRLDLLENRNTGNELLINWAKVLRDSYKLLLEHDDYVNRYEILNNHEDTYPAKTLLKLIQQEIHGNVNNDMRDEIEDCYLQDDSIQINGCYTMAREVEVLYNYLIDVFKADTTLGARDVLVMVSDIDKYAPFIRAVFNNAPLELPYSIADESVVHGNTLFKALRDILSVNPETFKSEEVLALLDSPFIRRRFGFKDIGSVRQAVREAGIFFGIESHDNEQTEAWMVSWDYGLEKIIYGLCISGEEQYSGGSHPLYPLDTAEGGDMGDRVRLYHFIQVLKEILIDRNQSRNLEGWSEYLGEIMKEMILDDKDDEEDFIRFGNIIENITKLNDVMSGEEISYQTFRQVFFVQLEQERRTNKFAGKGINFCSLVPMRSVPYRIISLLGMDFDKFPRQDSALSFSLIGKESKTGDRSVRENDKHLFLDTILAARDKIYISYLARNVQKGTDQPPSTLVDELLDYIALKTPDAISFKKTKIRIHPLHLFSTKYSNPENRLPANYLGNTLVNGKTFKNQVESYKELPVSNDIQLDQFASFFKHPVKYYFNKQLGVYYRDDEERLDESELFELDFLQEWKVKDELLRTNINFQEYIDRKKKSGQLPLANVGKVVAEDMQEEILGYKQIVEDLKNNNPPTSLQITYEKEDVVISGNIIVYGNKYIYCVLSSSALRQIMDPWIRYLVAIAKEDSQPLEFIFVFKKDKMPFICKINSGEITRDLAQEQLNFMIDSFLDGQHKLFPFYPPFGYYYYKQSKNNLPKKDLTPEIMWGKYEEAMSKDYDAVFTDGGYLEKVIDMDNLSIGLFSEVSVNEIVVNTQKIMEPLFERCPELFKSKL